MSGVFLDELRRRYDNESARNDTLEGKAANIITVAGTITSLVFGFIAVATSTFGYKFPPFIQWWIVASVVASVASILVSILALTLKRYAYLVNIDKFFQKDKAGKIIMNKDEPVPDANKIKPFLNAKDEVHEKALAEEYVTSIYINSNISSRKGKYVVWAFGFLVASIALIGAGIILTLAFPIPPDASGTYLCKLVEEGGREMTCRILE